MTIVRPTAPATARVIQRRERGATGPGSPVESGRRVTATTAAAITSTKTAEQTQNISHQRWPMRAASMPCACKAE